MESKDAITALSALAHDTRLTIFRLLVQAGATGMSAGHIARQLGIAASTLSNNLAILERAGLLQAAREGRSIRYFAQMPAMARLLAYILEDCCGGAPEICAPVLSALTCCAPSHTEPAA